MKLQPHVINYTLAKGKIEQAGLNRNYGSGVNFHFIINYYGDFVLGFLSAVGLKNRVGCSFRALEKKI